MHDAQENHVPTWHADAKEDDDDDDDGDSAVTIVTIDDNTAAAALNDHGGAVAVPGKTVAVSGRLHVVM